MGANATTSADDGKPSEAQPEAVTTPGYPPSDILIVCTVTPGDAAIASE